MSGRDLLGQVFLAGAVGVDPVRADQRRIVPEPALVQWVDERRPTDAALVADGVAHPPYPIGTSGCGCRPDHQQLSVRCAASGLLQCRTHRLGDGSGGAFIIRWRCRRTPSDRWRAGSLCLYRRTRHRDSRAGIPGAAFAGHRRIDVASRARAGPATPRPATLGSRPSSLGPVGHRRRLICSPGNWPVR